MRLVSVYDADSEVAATVLWDLLVSRPAIANISHKVMPTWGQHLAFIDGRPYSVWYLIEVPSCGFVGAI